MRASTVCAKGTPFVRSSHSTEEAQQTAFLRGHIRPAHADVGKTARKMSPESRARALAEFDLPDPFAALFRFQDAPAAR